jgi:hypothetical protein
VLSILPWLTDLASSATPEALSAVLSSVPSISDSLFAYFPDRAEHIPVSTILPLLASIACSPSLTASQLVPLSGCVSDVLSLLGAHAQLHDGLTILQDVAASARVATTLCLLSDSLHPACHSPALQLLSL